MTAPVNLTWKSPHTKQLCINCHKLSKQTFSRIRLLHKSKRKADDANTLIKLSEDSSWKSVIGLEIHAQIKSNSKLFSGAGTKYESRTNSAVSFFDAALPGTLPVVNRRCVEAGIKTAFALGCTINRVSLFDRKHYFYADLPTGFQITQHRKPLAVGGIVPYIWHDTVTKKYHRHTARLVQIQLEIDSGKSIHDAGDQLSLIDLNRAGLGLMEIVTAPDFSSADEAAGFVRDLRDVLIAVNTCDGKMNEGSLRVDANISVHQAGQPMGVRTEVKNLNSVKYMRHAINYEVERQINLLKNGGTVVNETMSYNIGMGKTVPMRDKEKILDYRFMPEPNLPPLVVYQTRNSVPAHAKDRCVVLADLAATMPELPETRRQRLETYGLSLSKVVAIERAEMTDLFENLVNQHGCDQDTTSKTVTYGFLSFFQKNGLNWKNNYITTDDLAEIVDLIKDNILSPDSVAFLLQEKLASPSMSLTDIIIKHNLRLIDEEEILKIIDAYLHRNPKTVKAYHEKGKKNKYRVVHLNVMKKLQDVATDSKKVEFLCKKRLDEWV